jgi:hypothetical protein
MIGVAEPVWAKNATKAITKAVRIEEGLNILNDVVRITVFFFFAVPITPAPPTFGA